MDAIRDEVMDLVDKELKNANLFFPLFASPHEGYSVILEEKEEVEEALAIFSKNLDSLWMHIRADRPQESAVTATYLKNYAVSIAVEAIQTAAMCQKYIMSIGDEE